MGSPSIDNGKKLPLHGRISNLHSAVSVIFPLGSFTGGQSSIPIGGSKALAIRMVDRYISLGGTVETSSEVVELDIEGKTVKEIKCENGKSYEADYYIVATAGSSSVIGPLISRIFEPSLRGSFLCLTEKS